MCIVNARLRALLIAFVTAAALAVGCGGDGNPSFGGGGGSIKTITAGGLTWTAENLNIDTGNSWCYYGNTANCKKYGRLYDWETAMTVCPSGWRLPSMDDWNALITKAGGYSVAGKKLKAKGGWYNSGNGTDSLGFSALPGGIRYADGIYVYGGSVGYWWSSTKTGNTYVHYVYMDYGIDDVYRDYIEKGYGFSVRCVKSGN